MSDPEVFLRDLKEHPEKQREFADQYLKLAEKDSKLKAALDNSLVRVFCSSCGELFLMISHSDFLRKSHQLRVVGEPDVWLLNAELHALENPSHEVVHVLPHLKNNSISRALKGFPNITVESLKAQREKALKYSEI